MMKKILTIFTILIFTLPLAFAVSDVRWTDKSLRANEDGSISVEFTLKNVGDNTAPTFVVEAQPFPEGSEVFSFVDVFVTDQDTCDPTFPKNVHKTITGLDPDESVVINLKIPPQPDGAYVIKGVSVDICCAELEDTPNLDCSAVDPFGWQTNLGSVVVDTSQTSGGAVPICGNGLCEGGESADNCAVDCGCFGGDGVCCEGETPETEPACKGEVGGQCDGFVCNNKSMIVIIVAGLLVFFAWFLLFSKRKII